MTRETEILQVAVPCPLHKTFDYLPPATDQGTRWQPGMRVRVPFGRTMKTGIITAVVGEGELARDRLKRAEQVLDETPIVPADLHQVLLWASGYYHHPVGEVFLCAIPMYLRKGRLVAQSGPKLWRATDAAASNAASLNRAPRQRSLLELLRAHPDGLTADEISRHHPLWRTAMKPLKEKGLVETLHREKIVVRASQTPIANPFTLNNGQRAAIDAICAHLSRFQPFLLDGITGSGKTEIYVKVIEQVLRQGRQALILVPEIGLTPQIQARLERRFAFPIVSLHSGLSERERLDGWLAARDGNAPIVIGTRSAVFTPLERPGIIIIDEEHDPSFKQQDGFRYHARDIALMRAKQLGIPVIMGSATPALESLYNCSQGRFQHLLLAERAGDAIPPRIRLVDMQHQQTEQGVAKTLLQTMEQHLASGSQVLLFLNRRGYAPTLYCPDCGWLALCPRCDAHMIVHHARQQLRCHHCDTQRPIPESCPQCGGSQLRPLGQGTERVESVLQSVFPDTEIIRIDRDSTRRRGAVEEVMRKIAHGGHQILIGTQMIAKGHHLPNVTLAAILDADQGMFGADFRAGERIGQLITQVAGRAGRADKPGEVIIQSHYPEHPAFHWLLRQDYRAFAQEQLAERQAAGLPPYGWLALLRAEAAQSDRPMAFLEQVAGLATAFQVPQVTLLGPAPAAMERRAGRYRAQLLLQASHRGNLHRLLASLMEGIPKIPLAKKVRWSLDVDPQEID